MHTPYVPWSNGNGVANEGMASFSQGARKGSPAAGGQARGVGGTVSHQVHSEASQGWAEWDTAHQPPWACSGNLEAQAWDPDGRLCVADDAACSSSPVPFYVLEGRTTPFQTPLQRRGHMTGPKVLLSPPHHPLSASCSFASVVAI